MVEKTISIPNTKDVELENLLLLEKASRIVCQKYENSVRNYDNTISKDNQEEYNKFEKYNLIHSTILASIEHKLNELKLK